MNRYVRVHIRVIDLSKLVIWSIEASQGGDSLSIPLVLLQRESNTDVFANDMDVLFFIFN